LEFVHVAKKNRQSHHSINSYFGLIGQFGEKSRKIVLESLTTLNILLSYYYTFDVFVVFNTTINNISAILWRSILLMEEIGIPGENHRPSAGH